MSHRSTATRSVRGALAALLLGLSALACSSSAGGAVAGSDALELRILGDDALVAALKPAPGEKAVLINFWATWCPPCVAEMPELAELYEAWAAKGVRVQTVALDVLLPRGDVKDTDGIAAFVAKKGWELPVIAFTGDVSLLQDRYQLGGALPTTIVVDADGEIVARKEGAGKRAGFERMIAKAL